MDDPHVYNGSNVLINTLNIKDYDQLEFVEKEFSTVRLKDIARGLLTEGLYDVQHFKQFHRYIFGDIYLWAGEFRKINIFKNETALNGCPLKFMDYESINSHLTWIFSNMNKTEWSSLTVDEQTHHFSHFMSEIWRAHAFREGNTRTTITFLSEFAKSKGLNLQSSLFVNHATYMRKALIASVFEDEFLEKKRNYEYLEKIIKDAIIRGNNN